MTGKFFEKILILILALSNGCETWSSCSLCSYESIEYLTCSFGHIYLKSSRLIFSIFALIHVLSTRGKSLYMIWAPRTSWKVLKVVREGFGKVCVQDGFLGQFNRPRRSDPRGRRSDRPGM
jgi:hypothetical protein